MRLFWCWRLDASTLIYHHAKRSQAIVISVEREAVYKMSTQNDTCVHVITVYSIKTILWYQQLRYSVLYTTVELPINSSLFLVSLVYVNLYFVSMSTRNAVLKPTVICEHLTSTGSSAVVNEVDTRLVPWLTSTRHSAQFLYKCTSVWYDSRCISFNPWCQVTFGADLHGSKRTQTRAVFHWRVKKYDISPMTSCTIDVSSAKLNEWSCFVSADGKHSGWSHTCSISNAIKYVYSSNNVKVRHFPECHRKWQRFNMTWHLPRNTCSTVTKMSKTDTFWNVRKGATNNVTR